MTWVNVTPSGRSAPIDLYPSSWASAVLSSFESLPASEGGALTAGAATDAAQLIKRFAAADRLPTLICSGEENVL